MPSPSPQLPLHTETLISIRFMPWDIIAIASPYTLHLMHYFDLAISKHPPSPSPSPSYPRPIPTLPHPYRYRYPSSLLQRNATPASCCVWVGNVCPEISEEEFANEFRKFGTVKLVRMFPSSRCAFVTFETPEQAIASQQLEDTMLGTMKLTLNVGRV